MISCCKIKQILYFVMLISIEFSGLGLHYFLFYGVRSYYLGTYLYLHTKKLWQTVKFKNALTFYNNIYKLMINK